MRTEDKKMKLAIHQYLKGVLLGMPTEQALDTIFRYYGSQNLLTQEFYENAVKNGDVKPMSSNQYKQFKL